MSLKTLLLVAFGGAIGSVLRYFISYIFVSKTNSAFPIATFIINILGCFFIGVFVGLSNKNTWFDNNLLLLLTTGFCGGFTTFSAFSLENVKLLQNGNYITFASYSILSVLLGIAFVFVGIKIIR